MAVGYQVSALIGVVARESERLFASKQKTATDMGASVAVGKSNQTIWLNCNAETRPEKYRKQRPMLN